MRDSINTEKSEQRQKLENDVQSYINNGGQIKTLNTQEFSTVKELNWSGREVKRAKK
tara:strand:- start:5481 stop:5651 length:171 start_codon:yes stop_codon:yes gene_type:complete